MILTDIRKNEIYVGVVLQKANASFRKHPVKNVHVRVLGILLSQDDTYCAKAFACAVSALIKVASGC